MAACLNAFAPLRGSAQLRARAPVDSNHCRRSAAHAAQDHESGKVEAHRQNNHKLMASRDSAYVRFGFGIRPRARRDAKASAPYGTTRQHLPRLCWSGATRNKRCCSDPAHTHTHSHWLNTQTLPHTLPSL